jgi:peptidoglycan hydrolase-like protein with peptidoglycan-binding domain
MGYANNGKLGGGDVITETVTEGKNLVDLNGLESTKRLREYKKSIVEPRGIEFNKQTMEHDFFPEEYFTNADVFVYFNDLWIDEITGLQFELNELVTGIHGYSSNTWDYVARGKRTVQGSFRIAFKEAGYMYTVLDHIGKHGDHKKTAISWLLNDEMRDMYGDGKYRGIDGVPDGYADVLENVETALGRLYGDPNAKTKGTTKTENYRKEFEWNLPLKIGSPNTKMKEPRTSTNQTGQVSQLQQRLIDLDYGWPEMDWSSWGKRYSGDTWRRTNANGSKITPGPPSTAYNVIQGYTGQKISSSSGDWYVCLRYYPDGRFGTKHRSIGGKDAYSYYEAQVQQRIDKYPGGLEEFWLGSSSGTIRYDGKFGAKFPEAIRLFQKIAGVEDNSKGYWVNSATKKALEAGLKVTGVYDVATRVAVWLFQENQIRNGNPYKIKKANGIVDLETRKALAEPAQRTVITPGENRYNPGEMAESLFTIYEKEVWGRPFVDRAEDVRQNESFFYRSRRSEEHGLHLAPLYQNGFDIYINYGPLPQYIQSRLNKIPDGGSFNTTVKALRNVQLTGVRQIMDAGNENAIEEEYFFIARDLD